MVNGGVLVVTNVCPNSKQVLKNLFSVWFSLLERLELILNG